MELAPVPGFSPTRPQLRRRGIAVVLCTALILTVVWAFQHFRPKDEFSFTLRTPAVAAGIVPGSIVRIQGLQVGTVTAVESLGNAQQGVQVTLDGPQGRELTNNVEAAFSAGNLFGVSEVILTPRDGGGPLREGAALSPTKAIADSTVANMIVTIGDVNSTALRPHASQILMNVDASSKALLPLFTALGSVAQQVHETQRISTAESFPSLARALGSADSTVRQLLPGFKAAFEHESVHNEQSTRISTLLDGITNYDDSLTAGLEAILTPSAIDGLKTASPMLVSLMEPILAAFPNGSARGVGLQWGQLMDNVRKAMPNTPNGPVLNLRLSVDYPAIAAMAPAGVR